MHRGSRRGSHASRPASFCDEGFRSHHPARHPARQRLRLALIYYYFKNKQDLFDATVQYALGEAAGVGRPLELAAGDPVQVIRDWLQHCLQMAEYNRTILRIMMHYAGSRRGGALEGAMQKFYQREEMEIFADSVRRGIASGLFRAVDPLALARYVSVHLDGITAASMVRRKFDVVAAFRDLEASIWLQLDYRPRNNPLEKKGTDRSAHASDQALDRAVGEIKTPVLRP